MRIPERRKDRARRKIHNAIPILRLYGEGKDAKQIFEALKCLDKPPTRWEIASTIRSVSNALISRST